MIGDQNPDAWEKRKLSKHTELITKGTTPKDKSGKGPVNFVKVESIVGERIVSPSKISMDEHNGYLHRSILQKDDILFSIAGTLGRTTVVDEELLPANTNQALAIIRGYDLDKEFLMTSLSGFVVKEFIRRNPTIGAQPNISLAQVGSLEIQAPGISEQKRIGEFFTHLNNTIALHQRKSSPSFLKLHLCSSIWLRPP
ncbi:restriction endonuclease subunit S [Lacticaseibacillus songhuajiangensis]|uniref:restriction endonuclease subunit S n=1 Tax=Lacticaseibacillus songhuajiangensis TaxID=1296539 RepID=UPI000F76A2C4|nr:restriction endonuclease subunit S [Lacticaseibacillus songhuajiangensis]